MLLHNLSRVTNPWVLSNGVSAGSGDTQTSSVVDTNEDSACYVFITLGTVASGGGGVGKLQMSADNGVSDPFTDIAGSGFTFSSTNSNQGIVIDVYRPQKRYIQAQVVRNGGGNTTIASIIALTYHGGQAPEQPGPTIANVNWLNAPGPGAA